MQYTVLAAFEIKARSKAKAEQLVTALAAEQFGALDCTILGIDPHPSKEEMAWAAEVLRSSQGTTEGGHADDDR